MNTQPLDHTLAVPTHRKANRTEARGSISFAQVSPANVTMETPQLFANLESVIVNEKPRALSVISEKSEGEDDPVMRRMHFRQGVMIRNQQQLTSSFLSQERGECTETKPRNELNASLEMLRQETAGMLSRHLPSLLESPPQTVNNVVLQTTPSEGISVDDRITPQTLCMLLHNGHAAAIKVAGEKTKTILPEKAPPNDKVKKLWTNVTQLTPPYVEHVLQSKVFDRPRENENTLQREVISVMAGTRGVRSGSAHMRGKYRSHLMAPPPTPLFHASSPQRANKVLKKHLTTVSTTPTAAANGSGACSLNVTLTRSVSAGDDTSVVEQIVACAASRRRPDVGSSSPSATGQGIPPVHPSYKPVFSALDAVLSVSKEYEKQMQSWPGGCAASLSASRHSIIERLTSVESSLIPLELWLTVQRPVVPGSVELMQKEKKQIPPKSSLLFPAVKANGRAQVYLLGDALDRMFQQFPDALKVLADKSLAQRLLPESSVDDPTAFRSNVDVDRLLSEAAMEVSDTSHHQYIKAADQVIEVIDVGIFEIVRQVACSCVERGALLDSLRLLVKDLTSSALWIMGYCKDQARREAIARRHLIIASRKDVENVIMLREQVQKLRGEIEKVQQANMKLEEKAFKFDALMNRLMLKEKHFSRHSPEEHLSALLALEESCTKSTTKGLEALYGKNDDTSHDKKLFDAPSTQMNNLRDYEEYTVQNEVYVESYHLLSALTEALQAVDSACEPLYGNLLTPVPFTSSNVAMMKWAEIARTVGSTELKKKHRQQVINVFTKWNTKQRAAVSRAENSNEKYTVRNAPDTPPGDETRMEQAGAEVEATTRTKRGRNHCCLITKADLIEMGVTDVSPNEVNELYTPGVEITDYLPTDISLPKEHRLNMKIVRDMIHDITESLKHITLRMNAISESGFVKESIKAPQKPPVCPEEACSLCGRRDEVGIEKKNRADALRRVVAEIQRRYEEAVLKSQRAEAERESYRKEMARIQAREQKQMQEVMERQNWLEERNKRLSEENTELKQQIMEIKRKLADTPSSTTSPHPSLSVSAFLSLATLETHISD